MRILLVGNFALDHQSSMLRYAEMLRLHLSLRGHYVELEQPPQVVGGLVRTGAARKWLGYVDKYLLFPVRLRARAKQFDLVHICDHSNAVYLPHTGRRPASITCHDLLAIASADGNYPEQSVSWTGRVQQRWILKNLAMAANVVCVSKHTASEFARLTDPVRPARTPRNIAVISHPLNFAYAPAENLDVQLLRTTLGLTPKETYLVHVGGNHWYKNRPGVLRIFAEVRKLVLQAGGVPPRLVMAGEAWTEEMHKIVALNTLEGSVTQMVNPSNEEVRTLYTGATGLLFPSLYEGFGWPLIEAQSCGCPVITSNRPPMTEVAGEAALYVDPGDEFGAASAIAVALDHLHLLREAGFENVRQFTPERIFTAYEKFFASVLAGEAVTAASLP